MRLAWLACWAGSAMPWYRARGNDPLLCIRSWLVSSSSAVDVDAVASPHCLTNTPLPCVVRTKVPLRERELGILDDATGRYLAGADNKMRSIPRRRKCPPIWRVYDEHHPQIRATFRVITARLPRGLLSLSAPAARRHSLLALLASPPSSLLLPPARPPFHPFFLLLLPLALP